MLASIFALLLGYLLGSIPSGVIVTRLAGAQDPRGIGSKNIGATNVLRTGRKDLAACTLLADALKGTIAILIVAAIFSGNLPPLFAAIGAFLGHLFPLFLGFRGGKGVATFLGCLIGIAWPVALVFALVWLIIAFATRYSSASALAASAASPIALWVLGRPDAALVFVALAAILWWKHSANIARLLAGTESKIGRKSAEPAT